mmetsp:Transcript_74058/g.214544  ORF Transcript_74058/g.214544 Transcript_74058/m.214544 type:complete len:241 (+) Transcript_74058:1504-2226(+)
MRQQTRHLRCVDEYMWLVARPGVQDRLFPGRLLHRARQDRRGRDAWRALLWGEVVADRPAHALGLVRHAGGHAVRSGARLPQRQAVPAEVEARPQGLRRMQRARGPPAHGRDLDATDLADAGAAGLRQRRAVYRVCHRPGPRRRRRTARCLGVGAGELRHRYIVPLQCAKGRERGFRGAHGGALHPQPLRPDLQRRHRQGLHVAERPRLQAMGLRGLLCQRHEQAADGDVPRGRRRLRLR